MTLHNKNSSKRRTLGLLSALALVAAGSIAPGFATAQSKPVLRIGYQRPPAHWSCSRRMAHWKNVCRRKGWK